ncbi:MAG: alpha/beta hydrolase [Planctomycetaceae bacterium]
MTPIVIAILLVAVAILTFVEIFCISKIVPIFEHRPAFGVEPSPPDPDAEPVSFATTNGLMLRGALHRTPHPTARGLVIFCPEMGGNHWSALAYAAALIDAGFHILAFDFRNQGESDRSKTYDPLHWLSDFEVADVNSAIAYARQRPDLRDLPMGLLGISRGGCAALAGAAANKDIQVVVCEGVATTRSMLLHYTLRWATLYVSHMFMFLLPVWHLKITLEISRVISQIRRRCYFTVLERTLPKLRDRRVLVIADGRDSYIPSEVTALIPKFIGGTNAELWIVPNARHNGANLADPEGYSRRLIEYFSEMSVRTPSTAS